MTPDLAKYLRQKIADAEVLVVLGSDLPRLPETGLSYSSLKQALSRLSGGRSKRRRLGLQATTGAAVKFLQRNGDAELRHFVQQRSGRIWIQDQLLLKELLELDVPLATLRDNHLRETIARRMGQLTWESPPPRVRCAVDQAGQGIILLNGFLKPGDRTDHWVSIFSTKSVWLYLGCRGTFDHVSFSEMLKWAQRTIRDPEVHFIFLTPGEQQSRLDAQLPESLSFRVEDYRKDREDLFVFLKSLSSNRERWVYKSLASAAVVIISVILGAAWFLPPKPSNGAQPPPEQWTTEDYERECWEKEPENPELCRQKLPIWSERHVWIGRELLTRENQTLKGEDLDQFYGFTADRAEASRKTVLAFLASWCYAGADSQPTESELLENSCTRRVPTLKALGLSIDTSMGDVRVQSIEDYDGEGDDKPF